MASDQWSVKADGCGKDGRREEGEAVVSGKIGRMEERKDGRRENEKARERGAVRRDGELSESRITRIARIGVG